MMQKGSDELFRMAYTELSTTSESERESWMHHPVTQALLHSMEGDFIDIVEQWENGVFTDKLADGTAQLNAKALGSAQQVRRYIDWIHGVIDPDILVEGDE